MVRGQGGVRVRLLRTQLVLEWGGVLWSCAFAVTSAMEVAEAPRQKTGFLIGLGVMVRGQGGVRVGLLRTQLVLELGLLWSCAFAVTPAMEVAEAPRQKTGLG